MSDSTETGAKMGRPRKEVSWDQIAEMCEIHCTPEEIANVVGVSRSSLDRKCQQEIGKTFGQFWRENADGGKASLRRTQYKAAMKGNTTMLKWIGANWLGQSEKQETTTTVHVSGFEVIPESDSQE